MISRKTKPTCRAALAVACVGLACLLMLGDAARAAPENPNVRHGQASFETAGNRTTITAGNNAVIDYTSFNIAADEAVRFMQPGERARVLNRVTNLRPTNIAGSLTANGHVYLVNPAGVYFAGGARIDVAGLHAAAGQMSISDFVNGIDRYTDLEGTVANAGNIRAGSAHLVGRQVSNTGTIEAGRVLALVAGEEVTLLEHGGHLSVRVDGSNLGTGSDSAAASNPDVGVDNNGTLRAGEQITLGAGDMYSLAIRNRGRITAAGGEVRVLANDGNIALADGSSISAAGAGDADGGEVIVNAPDGVTFFDEGATINVSGGPAGGDGGFAEVSGALVDFRGTVLTDGETPGTLLIDPWDLHIQAPDGGYVGDNQVLFNEPDTLTDVNVSPAALAALTGDILLQATNSLFVDEDVNLVNDNNVTLEALNDVVFNAKFLGVGGFEVTAGNEIVFDIPGLGPGTPGVESAGQQKYTSPVVLEADTALKTALAGGGVEFQSTVQKDPAVGSAGLWLNTSGVTFARDVGGADDTTALTSLHVSNTANIGSKTGTGPDVTIRTTGFQEYEGNVNLYSNAHLISTDAVNGGVHFLAEIDNFREGVAFGEEANLWIESLEGVRFDAFVSERTLVGALWVEGPTYMNGGRIATARDQIYLGPTYLMTDSLCVSTRGDVRFLGPVGAYTPFLNGDQARVNTAIEIPDDDPPGLVVHAEKLNPFFPEPGNIDELDPLGAARNGDVQFAGDIGAGPEFNGVEATPLVDYAIVQPSQPSQPSTGPLGYLYVFSAVNNANKPGDVTGDVERGVITFGGNDVPLPLITVNVTGDIRLNPGGDQTASPREWDHFNGYNNDIATIPTIATIASADGDVEFYTEDDFMTAPLNKITSVGKLTIYAMDDVTFGDLNAYISTVDPGDPLSIEVHAGDLITFLNRLDNGVREQDNSIIFDEGIDIVCQRKFYFGSTIMESSPGLGPPRFGTPDTDPDVTGAITAEDWEIIENVPLTEADFGVPNALTGLPDAGSPYPDYPWDAGKDTTLDLTIVQPPPPGDEVADDILLAPLPFEDRMVREPLLGPDQRAAASNALAMDTRDLTEDEFAAFNPGLQTYGDFVPVLAGGPGRRPVALNRVRRADAIQSLGTYEALFLSQVTDPDTGETRMVDQSSRIRQTLGAAWNAYQQQGGEPSGFGQWLMEAEGREDARQAVQNLSVLLHQLGQIGLSPIEYEQVVQAVLQPVTPENLTVEQLRSLLTGQQPSAPTAEREQPMPVG
jgi:filamentous hemagglutinin family protein